MSAEFRVGSSLVQSSLNSVVRNGKTTHLEPKMMGVLVYLAEHQGEVVSKEQLMRAVWADTFVTDDVLTRCISELRRTFEDDAKEPRVIQTIPRKGYRLVLTVHQVGRKTFLRYLIPLATLLLLFGVAMTLFRARRAPALTDRDSVLLADFINTTGDPVFDGTLKQGLAVQLEQSPFLKIFPEQRSQEALRYMGRSSDEQITSALAREICQREGIKAVFTGSIASLGSHYAISVSAEMCDTGESLAREQVEADSKEHVLQALDKVASRLRSGLGEPLSSVQRLNTPLQQATTSSLEALRAFTLGEAQRARGADRDAIPFYQRAVELDPQFAMAYARLSMVYGNLGEEKSSISYEAKAFSLRERANEREKLYIAAGHYDATGELDKLLQTYEVYKQTYPRETAPATNLALMYELYLGDYQKSEENARESLRRNQNSGFAYEALIWALQGQGRFEEAKLVAKQAVGKNLDSWLVHNYLYTIAAAQNDFTTMKQELDWENGKGEAEPGFLQTEADDLASRGQLRKAREVVARAVEVSTRTKRNEMQAILLASMASTEAEFGMPQRAESDTAAALAISHGYLVLGSAAEALVFAGAEERARLLISDLAKENPTNTFCQSVVLPAIHATSEINHGKAGRAVELLGASVPYELSVRAGYRTLYLRGLAYLRQGLGAKAAVEFQKIIDHPGIDPTAPRRALATLGLARAYALIGNNEKSRSVYQEFFARWKDADNDIPILQQAKGDYAKLQ